MTAVISTFELCRYFGDDEETMVKAVDRVSIEIERGEFTAIVGPSGSGKTTLLHLLGGLDNPTSGSVELSGTNIADMSGATLSDFRRDHIGFIFQSYNLIPAFSLRGVNTLEQHDVFNVFFGGKHRDQVV